MLDNLKHITFNQLYKKFYRKAFLFSKSYVKDDFAAEDIASEAMIVVWEKMNSLDEKQLVSFLFIILKNKSLDYLRSKTTRDAFIERMGDVGLRDLELRIESLEATIPDEILFKEVQKIINETLKDFGPQTREVFIMSRMKGLTNVEISEKMGITVKGVEYHITKVLKQLRLSLKDFLSFFIFMFLG